MNLYPSTYLKGGFTLKQELNSKYLSFEENAKIIYAGNRIYLTSDCRNVGGDVKFIEINKTSVTILKSISKNIESCDLVKCVLSDMRLPLKYTDVIEGFINCLFEKEFLKHLKDEEKRISTIKEIYTDKEYFLTHATVELTDKCNLMCKHCYMSASSKNKNFITYEDFIRICEYLVKQGVYSLELTGGEVFENPDFSKILEHALSNFTIVGLLTNGTRLIKEEVLKLLCEHKNKIVVSISIDSVVPEKHDEFRGVNGSWERSVGTIKKLVREGIRVRIASSIFEENMWEIDKLAKLSVDLGATVFSYNFIEDFGRGKNFNKTNSLQKDDKYVLYIRDIIEKYKNIIQVVEKESYERSGNCGAGTASIAINAKMDIRPCVLAPMSFNIGNIHEELVFKDDILKKLLNLKSPSIENGCDKNCSYLYKCRGCFVRALNVNNENKTLCEWIRSNNCEELLSLM